MYFTFINQLRSLTNSVTELLSRGHFLLAALYSSVYLVLFLSTLLTLTIFLGLEQVGVLLRDRCFVA